MKLQLFSIDSSETGVVDFWNGGRLVVKLGQNIYGITVGPHVVTQNYNCKVPVLLPQKVKAEVSFQRLDILGRQFIAVKVTEEIFVGAFEEFDQKVRQSLSLDMVEVMQLHGFVE